MRNLTKPKKYLAVTAGTSFIIDDKSAKGLLGKSFHLAQVDKKKNVYVYQCIDDESLSLKFDRKAGKYTFEHPLNREFDGCTNKYYMYRSKIIFHFDKGQIKGKFCTTEIIAKEEIKRVAEEIRKRWRAFFYAH